MVWKQIDVLPSTRTASRGSSLSSFTLVISRTIVRRCLHFTQLLIIKGTLILSREKYGRLLGSCQEKFNGPPVPRTGWYRVRWIYPSCSASPSASHEFLHWDHLSVSQRPVLYILVELLHNRVLWYVSAPPLEQGAGHSWWRIYFFNNLELITQTWDLSPVGTWREAQTIDFMAYVSF